MPFNYISHMFRAIWKHKIFEIWKPIENNKLFNARFTCNLSPKHV